MSNFEKFDQGGFVGPHEMHVTVDPSSTDPAIFQEACSDLGIKAHVIENEMPGGETVTDYLTGSDMVGRSSEAFAELGRIAGGLRASGLKVVREKIETVPWHPMSPKTNLDRLPDGTYFECHFTLPDLPTIHGFRYLQWGDVPFLISTTENKRNAGLLFATMRHYITTAGAFVENVEGIHKSLSQQLKDIAKPVVEFSLYDSNPDHDRDWVDAYRNR